MLTAVRLFPSMSRVYDRRLPSLLIWKRAFQVLTYQIPLLMLRCVAL